MEKLDEVVQFIEPKEVGLGVPTDSQVDAVDKQIAAGVGVEMMER